MNRGARLLFLLFAVIIGGLWAGFSYFTSTLIIVENMTGLGLDRVTVSIANEVVADGPLKSNAQIRRLQNPHGDGEIAISVSACGTQLADSFGYVTRNDGQHHKIILQRPGDTRCIPLSYCTANICDAIEVCLKNAIFPVNCFPGTDMPLKQAGGNK